MTTIRLHYWAGARAAAGAEADEFEAESVAAALALARAARDTRFAGVLGVCTILIDGVAADAGALAQRRGTPVVAEVLPPFAGGSTAGRTRMTVPGLECWIAVSPSERRAWWVAGSSLDWAS